VRAAPRGVCHAPISSPRVRSYALLRMADDTLADKAAPEPPRCPCDCACLVAERAYWRTVLAEERLAWRNIVTSEREQVRILLGQLLSGASRK
jgi:hypothetical protein